MPEPPPAAEGVLEDRWDLKAGMLHRFEDAQQSHEHLYRTLHADN